jgi:hypothetical protein
MGAAALGRRMQEIRHGDVVRRRRDMSIQDGR